MTCYLSNNDNISVTVTRPDIYIKADPLNIEENLL